MKHRTFFISVRTKLILIYVAVIAVIFSVTVMAFPGIVENWMIQRYQKDLLNTKMIIQETLENSSSQRQDQWRDKLDAVARAREIEIWICREPQQTSESEYIIPVIRLGSYTQQDLELSMDSAEKIEDIRNGRSTEPIYRNLFPDYFSGNTLTMAYNIGYYEERRLSNIGNHSDFFQEMMTMREKKMAVIFLHLDFQDFTDNMNLITRTIYLSFGVISLMAAVIIWILTARLVEPINQMREIANLLSKGDFSRQVTVNSSDEIGDLSRTFNSMVKELQEVEENREAFIANVSHDFRSPLTSIRGFVQAMMDDVIPQEQYPKYLKIVYDETNRLSKLTNDLLLLSKMQSGQDELHPVRFDINEMIVTLSLGFEQRIEQKNLEMKFNFLQEKLYVYADPDRIERVIYNLIDNAIKFTREGDSIQIETSIVNRKAFISISDTGIGMDEETMRHVFERFHKGDKSRGVNKSGMGLGLAIVKQIVVNHGEQITVHSKEGEGTRFEFSLPLFQQMNLVEKE